MKEMKLIDDLIAASDADDSPIKDCRVGISWTGVWGKYCGMSKTYGVPFVHGNYTRDLGYVHDKTTRELAEYSRSWNLVEASLGVAAINSMIKPQGKKNINALDIIMEMGKNKNITMVGKFPKIDEIREISKNLWILELDPGLMDPKEGIITEAAADYVIPDSDLVIITGSTLINKSLERFLKLSQASNAYTILMGPSTPLSDVLFDYGADMLAGMEITNPESILRKITQSGGMINSKVCKGEIEFRVMEG
jgi:uncharacterized protein (DUF4213/DUF364 family)